MQVTTRKGKFIKQFGGPGDNRIVCFPFWQAVIASGCPGECSYCFLQTQRPYRSGLYDLKGTLFSNLRDLEGEARRWLKMEQPAGLIVGENQDGLAFEKPYKNLLGLTPLEILIPLFERENPHGHTLIVLSKFVSTQYAEALGVARNAVFSWSLSLPSISEQYEKKVSPFAVRVQKALDMKARGYRVRFRLDALAPVPTWEIELKMTMDVINAVKPEMLTIGALRASNPGALRAAALANGRDDSLFDHLVTIDPSKFKSRTDDEFHVKAFRRIRELLDPTIKLGLCKEDVSLWRETDVRWQGCHCLHGADDQIATDRLQRVQLVSKET